MNYYLIIFTFLSLYSLTDSIIHHSLQKKLQTTIFPTFNFIQLVDHYDPLNEDTYLQRFNVEIPSGWKSGDPIFIFLAGEAPMEFFEFQEVQSRLWAKQFGAIYVSLEHRFYGESIPYNDTEPGPYSTENLQYLTSQQALADAAYFIEQFTQTLSSLIMKKEIQYLDLSDLPSKWIVFGCSYSGALSAWFRTKYPHLVVGSIAPSGPVYALTNYTSYFAWFEKVASPSCVAAVKSAVQSITDQLTTDQGRKNLSQTFNTCLEIASDPHDQYYFLYQIVSVLASSDQFENPPQWPLNATCSIMLSSNDYVANWAKVMAQGSGPGSQTCVDYNEKTSFIKPMRDPNNQNRSWVWQTCVEFGFYNPSYGTIFFPNHINLEHQVKWCEEIYGIKGMTPNTNWTNSYYGGYDIQGSNIMFSNGEFDPWHLLSINENNGNGVFAVNYLAGHCATMTETYDEDPPSLTQARKTMENFLQKLLTK